MTCDTTRSKMVAPCDIRRPENDDGPARPPHPSLRHRRDRQRKLALQKPRLNSLQQSALLRPAIAPAAQPQPAPPGRSLPFEHVSIRGPFLMKIRGPVSVIIDNLATIPAEDPHLRDDPQSGHTRHLSDREPSADVDAATHQTPHLLRPRGRGGDRAARPEFRATWCIPICAGAKGLSPFSNRSRSWSKFLARRWACPFFRSRPCASPTFAQSSGFPPRTPTVEARLQRGGRSRGPCGRWGRHGA